MAKKEVASIIEGNVTINEPPEDMDVSSKKLYYNWKKRRWK